MQCYYAAAQNGEWAAHEHGPAEWFGEIDASYKAVCGNCAAHQDIKILGDTAIYRDVTTFEPLH